MTILFQRLIDEARAAQAKNPAVRQLVKCPKCGSWIEGRPGEKTYCGICLEEIKVEK